MPTCHGPGAPAQLGADDAPTVSTRLLEAIKELTPDSLEQLCREAENLRAKQLLSVPSGDARPEPEPELEARPEPEPEPEPGAEQDE